MVLSLLGGIFIRFISDTKWKYWNGTVEIWIAAHVLLPKLTNILIKPGWLDLVIHPMQKIDTILFNLSANYHATLRILGTKSLAL